MAFFKSISSSSYSEQELIRLYRETGKLDLLSALYQPYMELVFGICLKYLEEREEAKDAVLAIFEELVPKLRHHEVENFKGWLYTLAKNHCLMQLRSSKHLKTNELDPERVQLTDSVHLNGIMEKEEHLAKLQDCLQTLAAEQKRMIELFYLQQKCYKEIAVITSVEWNKVRSHIQNGRRNLKNCMDKKIQHSTNE
ncbi:MAG: RNA polymerase subunit sigma-70 [Bacteroidetes bacterium]|nr:MAG: RNA polymerase subunit sigma-70 [Bacteroidota bacterium]